MCDHCECCHVPDLGACGTYLQGMNGRCVYCDHGEKCHPGKGRVANGPLWLIQSAPSTQHRVDAALTDLYNSYYLIGKDSDEARVNLETLMQAYDDFLD